MGILERSGRGLGQFGDVRFGYRSWSQLGLHVSRDDAQTRVLLKRTRLSNEISQSLSESSALHVPIPLSLVLKEQW
jgi:hypothetical protein